MEQEVKNYAGAVKNNPQHESGSPRVRVGIALLEGCLPDGLGIPQRDLDRDVSSSELRRLCQSSFRTCQVTTVRTSRFGRAGPPEEMVDPLAQIPVCPLGVFLQPGPGRETIFPGDHALCVSKGDFGWCGLAVGELGMMLSKTGNGFFIPSDMARRSCLA